MRKFLWGVTAVVIAAALLNCGSNGKEPGQTPTPTASGTSGVSPSPSGEVGSTPEGTKPSTVPTLRILQPSDGQSIDLPAEIRYEVTGFALGPGGGHLHAFVEGIDDIPLVEIPLQAQSGVVILSGNKLLTGRRNLTFQLALADHTPLTNPEARVTIQNLVIISGR